MSSELAMQFGKENGEAYGEVVSLWAGKLEGVDKISVKQESGWAFALKAALGTTATAYLASKVIPDWSGAGLVLPSLDTLKRFMAVAVLAGTGVMALDLLKRLRDRSNDNAAIGEMAARAPQTVAQIFDMIKDFFAGLIARFNQRKGNLTGVRTWHTGHSPSRHGHLAGQTRQEGEFFVYKGQEIYGPRPPGGAPADWSNCSCYLTVETKRGKQVKML